MNDTTVKIDLADTKSFERLEDGELESLIILGTQEQQRRGRENGDINALTAEGFERGFSKSGVASDPWLRNGLLVCMGVKIDKSVSSHTCSFVHIGEDWVWETEHKIHDTMLNVPGPKNTLRSVTIVAAYEGMEFDFISSRTRTGMHEMVSNKSFIIKNGEIVMVSVRAPKVNSHR